MNLLNVTRQFRSEDECLAFLESQRWPDGVIRCTTCGCDKVSKITRKTPGKNKRTRIYQCLEPTCKLQFSATSGTIYNNSHLPLEKWFMAIALMVDAKKGLSARQMQQHLGIGSYKTAWYLCHRIRKAMIDADPTPLTGTVEIDETYLSGTADRRFRKTPVIRPPKDMVLAMRERSTKAKVGRVRFFHVPDGKMASLQPIIAANLQQFPKRVITDQSVVYDFMFRDSDAHRTVNHSQEWIVPGTRIHTNTVESSFSLLKRGLIGSFHRVSVKHLHRYLTEFEYRFNARKADDRFSMTVREMMTTRPMEFKQLTAGE
jgi:ISXO2 transposase-like protein/transposase-like zinc ribbon protein